MFTDSRYWTQAARELSRDWELHRVGETATVVNWDKWILVRARDDAPRLEAPSHPPSLLTLWCRTCHRAGARSGWTRACSRTSMPCR